MPFDPKGSYDAPALYDMWFHSSRGPVTCDFESGGKVDSNYSHRIGQQARRLSRYTKPLVTRATNSLISTVIVSVFLPR